MVLRIKFEKHGAVRYIGHLDVMRFFQKAIRRAEIDVKYTAGYSPHQIMSFAQPLSVGHESNGEYMDIEVNSLLSCQDVKERLNKVSVPGIQVLSVKVLPEHAKNAMASVAAAEYTVFFKENKSVSQAMLSNMDKIIDDFLSKETIVISKEGKKGKGQREVDIRPGIYSLSWDKDHFSMMLNASSGDNVKPVSVLEALCSGQNEQLKENALFVIREDTYTCVDRDGKLELIPLGEIGEEI